MPKESNCLPLSFPGVDVVEASAGSGKTFLLAKRYLQLLMSAELENTPDPLRSILAITFTNKATVEMKERILTFLKMVALGRYPDKLIKDDILAAAGKNEKEARKKAALILDMVIREYNFFQIQTIDSFMNMMLGGCCFSMGLSATPRIKDDYKRELGYSLDKVLDKLSSDKKITDSFMNFLDYYIFVERKDGWFTKRDMLGLVDTLFNFSNIYGRKFTRPGKSLKDLNAARKSFLSLIKDFKVLVEGRAYKNILLNIEKILQEGSSYISVEKLSTYFRRENVPLKKGEEPDLHDIKLWKKIRAALRDIVEIESVIKFMPYIDIFELIFDEFRQSVSGEDVIFLQEINTYAKALTDGGIAVAEIYYRIAARIRHYLMDEFQDTSFLQWNNLYPLVSEALDSGGTLFYVGDKKQAIFGFRGGESSLFGSVKKDLISFNPEEAVLKRNFRSMPEIVGFNNRVFSQDNLDTFISSIEKNGKGIELSAENRDRILTVFSNAEQVPFRKGSGYVSVEHLTGDDVSDIDESAKDRLLHKIKELRERFDYRDITVLLRSNNEVRKVTGWLMDERVPVESEYTLNIRDHFLIKEIVSFLRFLSSPIDDIAFSAFIMGDIFAKSAGLEKSSITDFLFSTRDERKSSSHAKPVYSRFSGKFGDLWQEYIEIFFRSVGYVPLYELVTTIYHKFKIMDHFKEYQAFLMKFLEIVKSREQDYPDISGFLDVFDELEEKEMCLTMPSINAVKVMTIHKAKGLGFQVVMLPFLGVDVKIGAISRYGRKPYIVEHTSDGEISLVELKKEYGAFSDNLRERYMKEYTGSLIDGLNNIYVALTRAMCELYIYLPPKIGASDNLALALIGEENSYGNTAKTSAPLDDVKGKRPTPLGISSYSDWMKALREDMTDKSELVNRGKISKGNIMHFALANIVFLSEEGEEISEAVQKTGYEFPELSKNDLSGIKEELGSLLSEREVGKYFKPSGFKVYTEKEVLKKDGSRKIIDRLMVGEKEVFILDYKSSHENEDKHKEQVSEYVDILSDIYKGKKVTGYLVYLDSKKIETCQCEINRSWIK